MLWVLLVLKGDRSATAGRKMIHLETRLCSPWCCWRELGPLRRLPRAEPLSLPVAADLDLSCALVSRKWFLCCSLTHQLWDSHFPGWGTGWLNTDQDTSKFSRFLQSPKDWKCAGKKHPQNHLHRNKLPGITRQLKHPSQQCTFINEFCQELRKSSEPPHKAIREEWQIGISVHTTRQMGRPMQLRCGRGFCIFFETGKHQTAFVITGKLVCQILK